MKEILKIKGLTLFFNNQESAEEIQEIQNWFISGSALSDVLANQGGERTVQLVLTKISGQGFELIHEPQSQIRSTTLAGLYYGLGELLRGSISKSWTPKLGERALMLDMGRKFYSKQWIMELVKQMSLFKLNTLQLHFSENEGFRIESESYPELVSEEYLTKEEIREILSFARAHYIEIIPELDSPGHLKRFLKQYPQWRLEREGQPDKLIDHRALDITNPEAVTAVFQLIAEYYELFQGCRYFHIGADEFVDFDNLAQYPRLLTFAKEQYGEDACGIEPYIDYTNRLAEATQAAGFIPRVWNDGFYRLNQASLVELTKAVEITYWTRWNSKMAPVNRFLELGYSVINFNDNYFYFVLGEAAGYTYPTTEKISQWEITLFPQSQRLSADEMEQVKGASFAIWSDQPQALTQDEVATKVNKPLEIFSEKLWSVK